MRGFLLRAVALSTLAVTAPAFAAPGPLSQVLVDVSEDAQPVRDVLRRLEERHGLNYVVSEQVLARAGTVTVRLKQVPLDTALESICSAAGLVCEIRGPVVTILPKAPGAAPALPVVEEGLLPDTAPRHELGVDAGPPPALTPDDMTAIGKLEEVDLDNRRLQLRIDGTKVDFYLPGAGGGDGLQAARLETAVATLKPGARVALLYRRVDGRSIVTALIGGTRPPRTVRPRPAGAPRADEQEPPAAGEKGEEPSSGEERQQARDLRQPEDAGRRPAAPEVPPADQPRSSPVPLPEGTLIGNLVGREDDVVRIRRGDGEVVSLQLPPAGDDPERRERVIAAIDTMPPDGQIVVIYEVKGDAKVIMGTITTAR